MLRGSDAGDRQRRRRDERVEELSREAKVKREDAVQFKRENSVGGAEISGLWKSLIHLVLAFQSLSPNQ